MAITGTLTARVSQNDNGDWAATECFEGSLPCPALLQLPDDPDMRAMIEANLQDAVSGAEVETESSLPVQITGQSLTSGFPGFPGSILVSDVMVLPDRTSPSLAPEQQSYVRCVIGCLQSKKRELAISASAAIQFGLKLPTPAVLRTLTPATAPVGLTLAAALAAFFGGFTLGAALECFIACLPFGRLGSVPEGGTEGQTQAPETRTGGNPAFGPGESPEGGGSSSSWGSESSRGALVGQIAAAPPQVAAMGATHLLVTSDGMLPLRTINQVARQTLDACAAMGQGARVVGAAQGGVLLVDFAWCIPLGRA